MASLKSSCNRFVSFEERFERSYIPEPNSGCWLWLGSPCGSNGYGRIKRGDGNVMAHRASWELSNGKIPDGLLVLHRCDNPSCVNPGHLFIGTQLDNEADKVSKGRQARGEKLNHQRARGERNGNSKLTEADVALIRQSPMPQRFLAASYGVTQALISKIKRGEIWK